MAKNTYDAPLVKVLEVRSGKIFLASAKNVEQMSAVQGSWDEEEE